MEQDTNDIVKGQIMGDIIRIEDFNVELMEKGQLDEFNNNKQSDTNTNTNEEGMEENDQKAGICLQKGVMEIDKDS